MMKDGINMEKVDKVLLVDDDPAIVVMYERKLSLNGFRVVVAGNGEEGLAALKKERPEIILLDIMMPKLNGLDTLKIIKSDPAYQDLPVIILTNLGDRAEDVMRCKELGAADYWVKANTPIGEITERIKKIISRSKHN